jgi:hypothetical protein
VDPVCPEPMVSRCGGESAGPLQAASRTATTAVTRTERGFLERIRAPLLLCPIRVL